MIIPGMERWSFFYVLSFWQREGGTKNINLYIPLIHILWKYGKSFPTAARVQQIYIAFDFLPNVRHLYLICYIITFLYISSSTFSNKRNALLCKNRVYCKNILNLLPMMTRSKNNIDTIFSLLRKMAQLHLERSRRDINSSSRQEDIETVSPTQSRLTW